MLQPSLEHLCSCLCIVLYAWLLQLHSGVVALTACKLQNVAGSASLSQVGNAQLQDYHAHTHLPP
jgi:hypothetical protein